MGSGVRRKWDPTGGGHCAPRGRPVAVPCGAGEVRGGHPGDRGRDGPGQGGSHCADGGHDRECGRQARQVRSARRAHTRFGHGRGGTRGGLQRTPGWRDLRAGGTRQGDPYQASRGGPHRLQRLAGGRLSHRRSPASTARACPRAWLVVGTAVLRSAGCHRGRGGPLLQPLGGVAAGPVRRDEAHPPGGQGGVHRGAGGAAGSRGTLARGRRRAAR